LTKRIQVEELKLEEIDKKISRMRFKQTTHLAMINSDFISHFNDLAISVNSEIIKYFLEFMGFTNTPYSIIKVL
jgi:hypothetical protein